MCHIADVSRKSQKEFLLILYGHDNFSLSYNICLRPHHRRGLPGHGRRHGHLPPEEREARERGDAAVPVQAVPGGEAAMGTSTAICTY